MEAPVTSLPPSLSPTHWAPALSAAWQRRSLPVLLGLAALAALVGLLTPDLRAVSLWSLAAVAALAAAGIASGRRLERLSQALAQREHELELERRKVFHQEKMAAVGALAAGVLNDIGNPIAAIDGVARAMKEAVASGDGIIGHGLCDPELILRETARLQGVARMIAGLAATHGSEPQLLDLNEIVHQALLLLHFDPRMAGVRIETELDAQLPALQGVGDSLLLMMVNLLFNAADAVRGRPQPLIQVKTLADAPAMRLIVEDNGCGMDESTLRRAFEPMFTTKPAGHGTGLGLPLVRTIAVQHGGDVRLDAWPGEGTRATVRLGSGI